MLATLESMVTASKYFADDERSSLHARRVALGEMDGTEKAHLANALRGLIERGVSSETVEARTLARRWIELLLEDVGGDEGLLMRVYAMHWNEPTLHSLTGVGQREMKYIAQATAHHRLDIYAGYCLPEEIDRLRTTYLAQTAAWPPLIAAIRDQMTRGARPDAVEVQDLARRWLALSRAKAGGDPELQRKLDHAFQNEPALRLGSGIDASLMVFVEQAIRELETQNR
ncbi:Albicidin resistance protein [Labilithrix luteola]|uniref:Albicidin resistance protein n=1 Tax=Labilithrix luteola TaxID=1391654 RepID=A0A0K1Q2X0_9BACT|nr:hypothetical protein [Labilithrix luteola]AKU99714.1 Albicidin resistance protein [Labilithrix luteola]